MISSDGKFQTQALSPRVVIIEALEQDWYGWGNYEVLDDGTVFPAFIAYFGCDSKEQALAVKMTIEKLYRPEEVTARCKKNNRTGFPVELKIRGLQRFNDGLDLAALVEYSEIKDLVSFFAA
jgi:hypothetical protein